MAGYLTQTFGMCIAQYLHPFNFTIDDLKPFLKKDGEKGEFNPEWGDQYDWEAIRAIEDEHRGEQQKGIQLFAKHFYSLWD